MIKEVEYLFSATSFKKPKVYKNDKAISTLLCRLILLDPGSDPLHPEMGVGIRSYRYAWGKLDELKARVKEQVDTYLPCFPAAEVDIEITDDKLCNIKISINDTVYVYDSAEAPIPVTLSNINDHTITNAMSLQNAKYRYKNKEGQGS